MELVRGAVARKQWKPVDGAEEPVAAGDRRELYGDRRAGGGGGPGRGADRLSAAAAGGGDPGHGGRARDGVPQPAAAAAAGGRAGGGGDHVRPDVAARGLADDGLDRGAAGAA